MKNKNKGGAPEVKMLIGSQMELLNIKLQALNQVNQIMKERRREIEDSINLIALELGVPEEQLGEWVLGKDGKTLVRYGKKSRFPGLRTVPKREEKKKEAKKEGEDEQ